MEPAELAAGNDSADNLDTEHGEDPFFDTHALLCDLFISKKLDYPSLTVEWVPQNETSSSPRDTLLVGTQTDGEGDNVLIILELLALEGKHYGPDLKACRLGQRDALKVKHRLTHPGDVHKARICPERPDLIASLSSDSNIYLHSLSSLTSQPLGTHSNPSATVSCLEGHSRSGFALAWHPDHPDSLISGTEDGMVCYWKLPGSIPSHLSPQARHTVHTVRSDDESLRDISWIDSHCYASVAEDGVLVLYDIRTPDATPHKLRRERGVEPASERPGKRRRECELGTNAGQPEPAVSTTDFALNTDGTHTSLSPDFGSTSSTDRIRLTSLEFHGEASGKKEIFAFGTADGEVGTGDLRMLGGVGDSGPGTVQLFKHLLPGEVMQVSWCPHSPHVIASAVGERDEHITAGVVLWDCRKMGEERGKVAPLTGKYALPPGMLCAYGGHHGAVQDVSWHKQREWTLASVSYEAARQDHVVQVWKPRHQVLEQNLA